jgi:hypothetical protein
LPILLSDDDMWHTTKPKKKEVRLLRH